uniref:Uncharacterized protein n=1 Tax=Ditylenchus dipsaci TaxID=166011 RepID=A0A915E6M6_9BILA
MSTTSYVTEIFPRRLWGWSARGKVKNEEGDLKERQCNSEGAISNFSSSALYESSNSCSDDSYLHGMPREVPGCGVPEVAGPAISLPHQGSVKRHCLEEHEMETHFFRTFFSAEIESKKQQIRRCVANCFENQEPAGLSRQLLIKPSEEDQAYRQDWWRNLSCVLL